MLILKKEHGVMLPIEGGLTDKEGIYTICEADYDSIVQLVEDSFIEQEKKEVVESL